MDSDRSTMRHGDSGDGCDYCLFENADIQLLCFHDKHSWSQTHIYQAQNTNNYQDNYL